jgi:hypothetical protein
MARYKYLDTLVLIFVVVLLVSNLVAQKVCRLGPLTISGAELLFPITYIFGDVFTEVYGYQASPRAIWIGFFASALLSAAGGASDTTLRLFRQEGGSLPGCPLVRRERQGGKVGHIVASTPYFPWDLTARLWSTGITVTANGVPASSPTMGSTPGWLPPSNEFS